MIARLIVCLLLFAQTLAAHPAEVYSKAQQRKEFYQKLAAKYSSFRDAFQDHYFEIRQRLNPYGKPSFKRRNLYKMHIHSERHNTKITTLTMPDFKILVVMEDSIGDDRRVFKLVGPTGMAVPEFELSAGGKVIFQGKPENQGIATLPTNLNQTAQRLPLVIRANGFQETEMALSKDVSEIKLEWHPEVKKLFDDMVFVKGRGFLMGCTKEQEPYCNYHEKPAHKVTLSDFSIGKYEVTQAQWMAVMGENPSNFKDCDQCPVEQVSWEDCMVFIQKLNGISGQKFGLPTEAQWEYAARGGPKQESWIYSGSNQVGEVAWLTDNSGGKTQPVGQKKPNRLGLYDMSGNVGEWCSDLYSRVIFYSESSDPDPRGPEVGDRRVIRGGSWYADSRVCRVSHRFHFVPEGRLRVTGFRLTRD